MFWDYFKEELKVYVFYNLFVLLGRNISKKVIYIKKKLNRVKIVLDKLWENVIM